MTLLSDVPKRVETELSCEKIILSQKNIQRLCLLEAVTMPLQLPMSINEMLLTCK